MNRLTWTSIKAALYKHVGRFRQSTILDDTEPYDPLKGMIFGKGKADNIRKDYPHQLTDDLLHTVQTDRFFGLTSLEYSPELMAVMNATATKKNTPIKYCIMSKPRIIRDPKSKVLIIGLSYSQILAAYLVTGLDYELIPYEEWMEAY